MLRAGVVYSRLEDSNTPKDSTANPYEIEAMWRERFGLDEKASDRFNQVLLDFKNWKYDGVSSAFYDIDPDYTIEIGDSESPGGKFWWQEGLFEKSTKYYYHLKYKNIELHKIPVIHFRSENLCIPFPKIEYVTYPKKKDGCQTDIYCDLFYFQKDTIGYSLFKHITRCSSFCSMLILLSIFDFDKIKFTFKINALTFIATKYRCIQAQI